MSSKKNKKTEKNFFGKIKKRSSKRTELTEGEKEKIRIMLQKKRGVMVELICKVDKSILGGVIIETEDTVIDGSLKTKLRNVKEVMKA